MARYYSNETFEETIEKVFDMYPHTMGDPKKMIEVITSSMRTNIVLGQPIVLAGVGTIIPRIKSNGHTCLDFEPDLEFLEEINRWG